MQCTCTSFSLRFVIHTSTTQKSHSSMYCKTSKISFFHHIFLSVHNFCRPCCVLRIPFGAHTVNDSMLSLSLSLSTGVRTAICFVCSSTHNSRSAPIQVSSNYSKAGMPWILESYPYPCLHLCTCTYYHKINLASMYTYTIQHTLVLVYVNVCNLDISVHALQIDV